jgi:ketosteroid isomerase-like protein
MILPSRPITVLERLQNAMNVHDLDALVACFAPDFRSEQPNHPNRVFRGNDQVRKNWTTMFQLMSDLQVDVVRSTQQDDTIWSEWHWLGTLHDGSRQEMQGVIVYGVQDDLIAWGRLYMEDTEAGGADIDASLQRLRLPS